MSSNSLSLSKFKEKIKLEGESPLDICAFRMDGKGNPTPAMAKDADIGVSICDYLYLHEKKAILIEDTRLGQKFKNFSRYFQEEISKTNNKNQPENLQKEIDLFKKDTVNENLLKVYGALLVLCRLEKKSKEIASDLSNKIFEFWLVINDEENIEAIELILPRLKNSLSKKLTGRLKGAKLITQETKILLLTEFKQKISKLSELSSCL